MDIFNLKARTTQKSQRHAVYEQELERQVQIIENLYETIEERNSAISSLTRQLETSSLNLEKSLNSQKETEVENGKLLCQIETLKRRTGEHDSVLKDLCAKHAQQGRAMEFEYKYLSTKHSSLSMISKMYPLFIEKLT